MAKRIANGEFGWCPRFAVSLDTQFRLSLRNSDFATQLEVQTQFGHESPKLCFAIRKFAIRFFREK